MVMEDVHERKLGEGSKKLRHYLELLCKFQNKIKKLALGNQVEILQLQVYTRLISPSFL